MATKNNPVLGYIECSGCGDRCSVHQTTRGSGRFLYTRCGSCGVDQRTGAAVQSRLWYGAEWLDGAPSIPPPNLVEPEKSEAEGPELLGSEPGAADDPEPEPEPEKEPESEPEPESGSSGLGWLLVAIGGLAAVVLRGLR